jgi:hypothetical protein
MAKTVWECEACGEQFNSRAARLYHRNHTCPKIDHKPTPDVITPAEVKKEEPTPDPIVKPEPQVKYDHREKEDLTVDDNPTFDGDEPEIPAAFIFAAAFILMLIAGLVVFREKIVEFIRRKPPAKPTGVYYV